MGSGKHTFVMLDGLRGVAAISVVFYHFSRLVGARLLPNAMLAVDFFFALSGFVIAHAYEQRLSAGLPFSRFMLIRLTRLYPLYFLAISLPFVVNLVQELLALPHDDPLCMALTYVLHLVFLPTPANISLKPEAAFPLNGPSWSLSVEVGVNALYAMTFPLLLTRRLKWLVALSAMGLASAVYSDGGMAMGWASSNYWGGWARALWSFPAGVLVYRVFGERRPGALPSWAGLALVLVLLGIYSVGPEGAAWTMVWPVSVFPLMIWMGARVEVDGLSRNLCAWLGRVSYALYVIHMGVSAVMIALYNWLGVDASLHLRLNTSVWTAVAVAVAWALDVAYDVPVRKFIGGIRSRNAFSAGG